MRRARRSAGGGGDDPAAAGRAAPAASDPGQPAVLRPSPGGAVMSNEAHDCDDAGAPPLTRAETLVLWALRAWVAGHRHGIPVLANLRTAFRNEGAPAAAEAVDDLMGFIANGAGRTIQVNCPRCRQVTEDERLLLDVVALHQQGETLWVPFLARAILT